MKIAGFAVLWILSACSVQAREQIEVSQPFSIAGLQGVKTSCGTLRGKSRTMSFDVEIEDCAVYSSPLKDHVYLKVADLPPSGKPGEPQLPMKTIIVELPRHARVCGAELTSGSCTEIKNSLTIVPMPEPGIRMKGSKEPAFIPDQDTYSLSSYFPGNFVSFEQGSDGKQTYCFLRIFPVQYIPANGKAILLTRTTVTVYYEIESHKLGSTPSWFGPERNAIICPQEFEAQAESLKAFHESKGIPSAVITCEWITANCDTAPRPGFPGYSSQQPSCIQGYDFDLARRIVDYLRTTVGHPDLEYVTLLGDAEKVPPSYYYYVSIFGRDVYDFAPSDFLYSSPDYDFVPDFKVGRLSVSDTAEANNVIAKIKSFDAEASWTWFQNAMVAGGNAFPSAMSYYDELFVSDMINREGLSGHDITKCFLTDNRFTASIVDDYISNGDVGIISIVSHGSGDAIWFDDGTSISGNDMMLYPPRTHLPVISGPACVCGAFDTDLVPGLGFSLSFAEGVLKSPGAGICFLGGSRPNLAGMMWAIDKGRVAVTGKSYIDQVTTLITDVYHAGADELGELVKQTQFDYAAANPMTDTYHRWTMFCFLLIGDPALGIPAQVPGPDYDTPFLTAQTPTFYNATDIPVYELQTGDSAIVSFGTNSPSVNTKLCNAYKAETAVDTSSLPSSPFEYAFAPEEGARFYLVRAISEDGKEGWMYTYTATGKIAVDGDKTDWGNAGLTAVASDPDDFSKDEYEVLDLYVTDDKNQWYIGFDVSGTALWNTTYGIAIDCESGGYTGTEGVDKDAFGNWITFGDSHSVDYEIYMYPARKWCCLFSWNGSSWTRDTIGISLYTPEDAFAELALPKTLINDPDTLNITLFSTGLGNYYADWGQFNPQPAQDASPSDPATYFQPWWGQGYANTLTQFVTVGAVGVEEETDRLQVAGCRLEIRPNPFAHNTVIQFGGRFAPPAAGLLHIYDLSGRLVRSFPFNHLTIQPFNQVTWDGRDNSGKRTPAGIYLCRLDANGFRDTKKLILMK
jgi:hypothetical protein